MHLMRKRSDIILAKNIKQAIHNYTLKGIEMPDGVPIPGPFYHGTGIIPGEGVFNSLQSGIADFDALWVATEQWVSEIFASNRSGKDSLPVVYKTTQNLEKAASLDQYIVNEMMDRLGLDDPRELIPHLSMEGYDGWTTLGSVNSQLYTDIAIFANEVDIDSMKVFIDDDWTDFFAIEEFTQKMSGKMESDHLERFTRVMHV